MEITLKLDPAPTFWAKVQIPVPGSTSPAAIECEFVHMSRDAYVAFVEASTNRSDLATTLAVLKNWKGPDAEFSEANLSKLLQNYHGAAYAIAEGFAVELSKARLGN